MKMFAIRAIACLILLPSFSAAQDVAQAPPPPEHRPQQLQIWDGFWHARINLRYHTIEAREWDRYDKISRGAVVLLAILSLAGPYVYEKKRWKYVWYGVGAVALAVTVAPFIWPFTEWSSEDTVFIGRWNELANEWYDLYEKAPSLDPQAVEDRISLLKKTQADIESDEKGGRYDPDTMLAAEKAERAYQGFDVDPGA